MKDFAEIICGLVAAAVVILFTIPLQLAMSLCSGLVIQYAWNTAISETFSVSSVTYHQSVMVAGTWCVARSLTKDHKYSKEEGGHWKEFFVSVMAVVFSLFNLYLLAYIF